MKIAVFHLGFFYSGGGEKLILEEIRGLRALGHKVNCYAPYVDREECFPGVPEMVEEVERFKLLEFKLIIPLVNVRVPFTHVLVDKLNPLELLMVKFSRSMSAVPPMVWEEPPIN